MDFIRFFNELPSLELLYAIISETIDSAISFGPSAPISKPIGPKKDLSPILTDNNSNCFMVN